MENMRSGVLVPLAGLGAVAVAKATQT